MKQEGSVAYAVAPVAVNGPICALHALGGGGKVKMEAGKGLIRATLEVTYKVEN